MSEPNTADEAQKEWVKDWERDPELMELIGECGELADCWLQRFEQFDAIVAWAERIAAENGGKIVEKHFDTIRVEFEEYPNELQQLQGKYPGLITVRDAMGDEPPEMEIELGWGVEPRGSKRM